MKPCYRFIRSLICLILVGTGNVQAETHEELVTRYIEISEAQKLIDMLQQQAKSVQDSLSVSDSTVEGQLKQKAREIMIASFDRQKAGIALRSTISRNLNDKELMRLITWYQTPLSRKVEKAFHAQIPEDSGEYLAALSQSDEYQNRLALIRRFDASLRLSEMVGDITYKLLEASVDKIKEHLSPEHPRYELQMTEPQKKTAKFIMLSMLRGLMEPVLLINSRSLTDKDIEGYIAFYQKEPGIKEIDTQMKVLSAIMQPWMDETMEGIIQYAESIRKSPKP